MGVRFSRSFGVAVLIVGLSSAGLHAQKPAVESVLQTAADYLVKYSQTLSAVAAEEDYVQYDTASGQMGVPRRLTADVVIVGIMGGAVRSFRDVAAIDNKAVRAHDDRLLTLLKSQDPNRLIRAQQLSEDSVRYYVNSDLHALDDPALALEFLRKENQPRSTFKLDGVKTMGGAQVAIVKFSEQNPDRLIQSPENGPGVGKFWIDVATGAVRQTELSISGRNSNFQSAVKYTLDPGLGVWVPSEMTVDSHVSAAGTGMNNMGGGGGYGAHGAAEAHVSYTKYRR